MLITIVWDGQRIPNCDPPSGTYDAIKQMQLSEKDAEHLWALWASLDALIDKFDDVELWQTADVDEIADLISHPDFIGTSNSKDDEFDWSQLPGWVRDHADKLTFAPPE
jgi:hypothetical protein